MNNRIYQSPDLYTVVSNRLVSSTYIMPTISLKPSMQLTSLYSLQSSLDILRAHRPDFTPRTGFVWPIVDTSVDNHANKKRGTSEEPSSSTDDQPASSDPSAKRKAPNTLTAPKRPQNNPLLLNAMRTTAAHSNLAFASSAFLPRENAPSETVAATKTAVRSSDVPAPAAPVQDAEKQETVSAPVLREPPPKGPAGAGKKKRKRECALLDVSIFLIV
jgi:mediator of RNA polymerase II transcription subunit 6